MTTPRRLFSIAVLVLAVALVYALKQERPVATPVGELSAPTSDSSGAVTPGAGTSAPAASPAASTPVQAGLPERDAVVPVSTTDAPATSPEGRRASTKTPQTVALALPRLVDVGADKCIPCKAMAPILENLRQEYAGRLRVDFIDAWKYPDKAKPFNVYGIPTQIFFDPSGRELYRHVGFISKEEILATWQRLGFSLNREKS
jgi:thioredoxin 1